MVANRISEALVPAIFEYLFLIYYYSLYSINVHTKSKVNYDLKAGETPTLTADQDTRDSPSSNSHDINLVDIILRVGNL